MGPPGPAGAQGPRGKQGIPGPSPAELAASGAPPIEVVRAIDRHVENIYAELDAHQKRLQELRAELASLRQAAQASLQNLDERERTFIDAAGVARLERRGKKQPKAPR